MIVFINHKNQKSFCSVLSFYIWENWVSKELSCQHHRQMKEMRTRSQWLDHGIRIHNFEGGIFILLYLCFLLRLVLCVTPVNWQRRKWEEPLCIPVVSLDKSTSWDFNLYNWKCRIELNKLVLGLKVLANLKHSIISTQYSDSIKKWLIIETQKYWVISQT